MTVALLFAASVTADEGKRPATDDAESVEVSIPALSSGMIVQIDPETGKLRQPTPEEAAKLSEAFAAMRRHTDRNGFGNISAPARGPVYHANGMVSAELDPALHEHTVIRVNADGEWVAECIKGEEAAAAHAAAEPTPNQVPAPQEEQ
ncbi:MAG: hypothetical protein AAF481_07385 [Acidobacteriota bacterium]